MTGIIFVSGLAANRHPRLGGLTLLERVLIVARRAGVRRCLIAGTGAIPPADARMPRLTPVLDAADAKALLRAEGTTRVLCMHGGVVTMPATLARFLATPADAGVVALHSIPVAHASPDALDALWPVFLDAGAAGFDQLAPLGGLRQVHLPEGIFAWVRRGEQVPAVERQLLLGLENPRDGRVDTLLNRRLSRPISRALLRLPLTPNHVTLLSFVSCLLAAMAFARGTYFAGIAGAVLFQLAAVLDCCDGEVARVKLAESDFGDVLDISFDAIGNVAIFLGIARGAWLAGQLEDAALLGLGIGIGIAGTFPLVTYIERSLPTPAATPEHRLAQRLVTALTSRDFSILVGVAAVTATLPWFLRGAAVGANVFWVLLAFLVWRGR